MVLSKKSLLQINGVGSISIYLDPIPYALYSSRLLMVINGRTMKYDTLSAHHIVSVIYYTDTLTSWDLADSNKAPVREFLQIYMEELKNCVKFTEKRSGDYANVVTGSSCSATVGYMEGGIIRITLPDECVNKRNVKHEFTHLLGFMHEHSRPDRDNHLDIFYENVNSARKDCFILYLILFSFIYLRMWELLQVRRV